MKEPTTQTQDIYAMNLHERFVLDMYVDLPILVTRVPGGWIYTTFPDTGISSVYVPYHNDHEFKTLKESLKAPQTHKPDSMFSEYK